MYFILTNVRDRRKLMEVNQDHLSYTFDYNKKPIAIVREGQSFTFSTQDNLSGLIRSEKDLPLHKNLKPYSDSFPQRHNPVTGPFYIEGAEPGDMLEISIENIVPDDYGITCIIPGMGPLKDSVKWPELGKAYTKKIKHIPGPSGTTSDGIGIFDDKVSFALTPFIGTIGVCPEFEVLSTMTGQFPCCGNWDSRDINIGSRLYVNCYHPGGLLYAGDVHASQGDTEWTCVADETKADVTLSCKVIKDKNIPYARIEKEGFIIQLYADKPMEEAVHHAIIHLMDWIVEDYGINPRDLYAMISILPDFRIRVYQMIRDPLLKYVVGAEFPKKYLI
jgi:amidase